MRRTPLPQGNERSAAQPAAPALPAETGRTAKQPFIIAKAASDRPSAALPAAFFCRGQYRRAGGTDFRFQATTNTPRRRPPLFDCHPAMISPRIPSHAYGLKLIWRKKR